MCLSQVNHSSHWQTQIEFMFWWLWIMLPWTLWFSLVHSCISWSWKMIFPKSSLKGNSHRYSEYFFNCWLWNPFNILSLNKGQHCLPVALVNHYGTNNATTVYASMNSAALFLCACICMCLSIYNLISSNILRTPVTTILAELSIIFTRIDEIVLKQVFIGILLKQSIKIFKLY